MTNAILLLAALGAGPNNIIVPEHQGISTRGPMAHTGFEDLNQDGSDATNFTVGTATFSGGAAGTRNFPPGYWRGHFAFITAGQLGQTSVIRFRDSRNQVHFRAKDIRELIPGTRGTLVVLYKNGARQRVPLTGQWQPYKFRNVASITVETNGVSNLDTFHLVSR